MKSIKLNLASEIDADEEVVVSIEVKNNSELKAREVVQFYISDLEANFTVPQWIKSSSGYDKVYFNSLFLMILL